MENTNLAILPGPVCTSLIGIEGNQKVILIIENLENCTVTGSDHSGQVYQISFFHFPSLDSPVLSVPRAALPEMGSIQTWIPP